MLLQICHFLKCILLQICLLSFLVHSLIYLILSLVMYWSTVLRYQKLKACKSQHDPCFMKLTV